MKRNYSRVIDSDRIAKVTENVRVNSRGTCEYLGGFQDIKSLIDIKCLVHNNTFKIKYENIRHAGKAYYPCLICQQEQKQIRLSKTRHELICAYCGKTFTRTKAALLNSRSGLYFCCRECKDLSQRLSSGEAFNDIRPDHYGVGANYRDIAFRTYEHKCACCGWDEDIRILEVHHIDSNRENNNVENLVILCAICHRKITLGYYLYDSENKKLIPVQVYECGTE